MNTQKPRVSRLQFSLRAILVLLTLAAIGGWWWQKRFHEETFLLQSRRTSQGVRDVEVKKTVSKRRHGLDKILLDGPTTIVDDQGNLISEEEWLRGRRHGVYRRWDSGGKLLVDCEFRRGKLVRVGERQVEDFFHFAETTDSGTGGSDKSTRILRALCGEAQFSYSDQPLDEVIDDIRFTYMLSIVLDKRAMEEIGLATDTPITSDVPLAPLFVALLETLAPLKLACAYRHEVIWITTPDSPLFDDEKAVRVASDGRSPNVDQVLAGPVSFDYLDQTLNEVLDDIAFTFRIKIERELEDPRAGLSSNVKGISLRSALGILCHTHNLQCVARDDRLVVTDAEPIDSD